jgi:hypothetical protein
VFGYAGGMPWNTIWRKIVERCGISLDTKEYCEGGLWEIEVADYDRMA